MKKEDFKVGQTVYVYLLGYAARGKQTDEDRIEEWEVIAVGRKYLQAKNKNWSYKSVKFDMTNNFKRDNCYYSLDYEFELYATKEELLKELWRRKAREEIEKCLVRGQLRKLNDEELETVYDILKK